MLSKMITATMLSVGLGITASAHSQTDTSNCCQLNLTCCEQGQACCITSSKADCCLTETTCCETKLSCCETGGNCCIESPTANSPPQ